ncbi:hypothetical protein ES319_A08G119000v1 [Gossypium barbadense]|uniref:Uncharacterized protein n=3 Tax=Gossypium TaxID=3633 RepID=A0A5J5UQW6_GOSBA|nr:hypothetical protein ES319_A08G119000v1 [Gossypium barbadense]TYH06090.1 hypothetical protein ES288_A08G130500v1 [Gossypium darwinii]TYI14567.1 hypothetical protein ES332_A08G129600v1 [Gossypium tomentosum]
MLLFITVFEATTLLSQFFDNYFGARMLTTPIKHCAKVKLMERKFRRPPSLTPYSFCRYISKF